MMSLRPLFGHLDLRRRLADAIREDRLPASLLLTGPRGVGKQRLALWLGQRLLCDGESAREAVEPCGRCVHCRYALLMQHPDLHWYFPRTKPKGGDPSPDDARADLAEGIEERITAGGLWAGSTGMQALHIAVTRALLHDASMRPALATKAAFVVGDAERMVAQEGADQAANAFLKLLEEPPPGTTLILTSSEPGALLPTIRSRVITQRVGPLSSHDVAAFLAESEVAERISKRGDSTEDQLTYAAGAPGRLLEGNDAGAAYATAQRVLDAALAPRTPEGDAMRALVAAGQGVNLARGSYSDMLDALTALLHEHMRHTIEHGNERGARRAAHAISVLETTKTHTQRNVTPLLMSAVLLDDLASLLASS